jgi:DNA polymerase-3 subunit beta
MRKQNEADQSATAIAERPEPIITIDVAKDVLSRALKAAALMTAKRSSIDLFRHFLLTVGASGLSISSCNGETWFAQRVACLTSGSGSVCVSAANLIAIIDRMPDGDISFEIAKGKATIRSGRASATLPLMDATDWPAAPEVSSEASTITMRLGALQHGIGAVLFAASKDAARPVLQGVHIATSDGRVQFVATNTHVLAVQSLEAEVAQDVTATIPVPVCEAIIAMAGEDEPITVTLDARRLTLEHHDQTIVTQLLASDFPDWGRVIPSESTTTLILDADVLSESVRRVSYVARLNSGKTRFAVDGDTLMVSAVARDVASISEGVLIGAVDGQGAPEIVLNNAYLADALKALEGSEVRIGLTTEARPVVIKGESADWMALIMPMNGDCE